MPNYYVDMDKVAAGGGTFGDPWNLNDVVATPRTLANGDTAYLKGRGATTLGLSFQVASPTTESVTFLPWTDEMSAFCIDSGALGDSAVGDNIGARVVKRMISSENEIGYSTLLESCIYITQQNIGIMYSGLGPAGSLTIAVTGCTFKTNNKSIVVSDSQGGSPNITTVNFTSCLFIDTIFDGYNNGTTENEVINCVNCTFIGKSEAEVKAGFETHSGTVTFDADCRFSAAFPSGAPSFPSNISQLLDETSKLYLRFSDYDDGTTTLRGPVAYDYSSDGVGIFGGERRGVGAWWFDNEYYVNLASTTDAGTGTGLSVANAMGTTTLKLFLASNAVVGRYLREDDTLRLFNDWTMASGDTLVLPTALQTLGTYKSNPVTSSAYLGIKVKPIDSGDPFKIITASSVAARPFDSGSYNFIERMITDSIYLCYNTEQIDIKSCLFINSTKIRVDLSLLKSAYIKGCTFLTPEVEFKATTASDINFDQCLFAEYNGTSCLLTEEVTPGAYNVNITNSRFIATEVAANADVSVNVDSNTTYENALGSLFPITIGALDYLSLRFITYNVANNLVVTSPSYTGFDFGLWDNPRLGVGAFFFTVAVSPGTYYFDVSAGSTGTGVSISDPWDLSQLIDYFDGTSLTPSVNGDVLKGTGSASITTADLFSVNIFDVEKSITIEAYDLTDTDYGPIILEVDSSLAAVDVNIFHFLDGTALGYPTVFNIKDFVILAPTSSCASISLIESDAGYTAANFYNTLVIADVPTRIILTGDSYTEIDMYGSTLSIGANGSFRYGTGIGSNKFYDCVLNINSGASITMTGTSLLDHCETNRTSIAMAATSTVNSTFEKSGVTALLETLVTADFDIQLFVYKLFSVTNTGNSVTFWNANDFNYGIGGNVRNGIGFFYFIDRQLWVDGAAIIDGDGLSESSPFTYPQIRNYFNTDEGVECGTFPINADIVNVKGVLSSSIVNTIFNIKRNVPGSITIRAWDIATNGLFIIENTGPSTLWMFKNVTGYGIDNIIMSDFILLESYEGTPTTTNISTIASPAGRPAFQLDLKNFMLYTRYTAYLSPSGISTINCYGYSINCNILDLTVGAGDVNLYDGVVKTGSLLP